MNYNNVRSKWNFDLWLSRIVKVEDEIADIANRTKLENNMDMILLRNYGRLNLTLKEMFTLLDNGYPDGALSIARNAYELMIITEFIYSEYEKDPKTDLLERYFADQNVKAYYNRKMLYKNISKELHGDKNAKNIVKQLNKKLSVIKKRYKDIRNQYWWAQKVLKCSNPSFSMIDKSINEDFVLRTLYNRACISIHASAIGAFALLGRDNKDGNKIYTTQTDEQFEVPILLGMYSHDRLVKILCRYWDLHEDEILDDIQDIYAEYAKLLFQRKY